MCVHVIMGLQTQSRRVLYLEEWEEFVGVFLGVDYEEGGIIFDDFVVIVSDGVFSRFALEQDFYRGKKIGILKYGLDRYKLRIIS